MQLKDSKSLAAAQGPGTVTMQDIEEGLLASKPSASLHQSKYKQFSDQHGQAAG